MVAEVGESFALNLTTVLIALVALSIAYYAFLVARFVRERRKIGDVVDRGFPGPEKHWLYGNLRQHPGWGEEGLQWMVDLGNKYKTSYRLFWGFLGSSIICVHPDSIKPVLRSTQPKPLNGTYRMIVPWLGEGLLLSSGNKWFRNRRLLTPAFHFDVLKPYMKIYNEASDIFLGKLEEASKAGGSVEIFRPVTLMTLNIIMRCAFSSDVDVQRVMTSDSQAYVNAVLGMGTLSMKRIFNPLVHADFPYSLTKDGKLMKKYLKTVHTFAEDVIAKRKFVLKENPEEGKKRYLDFLDILLLARDENDEGLTDREIRDEVDTFLFEGHDTTASAISWLMYELSRNADHQETCREEVLQFMGGRETNEVEWDDLTQMHFTTKFIKETIRMHSPVPFIGREVSTEFELQGVKLKPGTFIELGIYLANHNEHVWGLDHMEFKPERFDSDNVEQMDSFAYVPFSAGPRNCIGQNFAMHEIKVVASKILNRFVLTLDPDHEVKHKMEFVMRAENGIKMFIKPRH